MLLAMKQSVQQNPAYHFQWLTTSLLKSYPFYEVAVVGKSSTSFKNQFLKEFIPNICLMGSDNSGSLELLKDKNVPGKTMIYVCENRTCKLPVENFESARKQIITA